MLKRTIKMWLTAQFIMVWFLVLLDGFITVYSIECISPQFASIKFYLMEENALYGSSFLAAKILLQVLLTVSGYFVYFFASKANRFCFLYMLSAVLFGLYVFYLLLAVRNVFFVTIAINFL